MKKEQTQTTGKGVVSAAAKKAGVALDAIAFDPRVLVSDAIARAVAHEYPSPEREAEAARMIADLVKSATPLIERFDLDGVEREIAAFEHRIDQALIPVLLPDWDQKMKQGLREELRGRGWSANEINATRAFVPGREPITDWGAAFIEVAGVRITRQKIREAMCPAYLSYAKFVELNPMIRGWEQNEKEGVRREEEEAWRVRELKEQGAREEAAAEKRRAAGE